MKTNPVLKETWKIKDNLAREAGYDTHRFFEGLRQWAKEHPHRGRVAHSAAELRRIMAEEEHSHVPDDMVLKDEPPI